MVWEVLGVRRMCVESHVRSGEASSDQWWSGQSVIPQSPLRKARQTPSAGKVPGSHDGNPSIAQSTG